MDSIVEGLVIGIGSGVTLSAIAGFLGWVRHRSRRRDQVGYFRKLIVEGHARFHQDYSALSNPAAGKTAYFDETYREIQAALSSRSSNMTFDQTHGIKRSFFLYEWFFLQQQKGNIDQLGTHTFSELRKLRFLKLDKLIPAPDEHDRMEDICMASGESREDSVSDRVSRTIRRWAGTANVILAGVLLIIGIVTLGLHIYGQLSTMLTARVDGYAEDIEDRLASVDGELKNIQKEIKTVNASLVTVQSTIWGSPLWRLSPPEDVNDERLLEWLRAPDGQKPGPTIIPP